MIQAHHSHTDLFSTSKIVCSFCLIKQCVPGPAGPSTSHNTEEFEMGRHRSCFGYPLWTGDSRSDLTFIGHNACYRPFLFCVHLMSANVLLCNLLRYLSIRQLPNLPTTHGRGTSLFYVGSQGMHYCFHGLVWFNFNRLPILLMGLAIIERQSQLDTAETRT